jgi:anti-sigma factor RsiW
MTHQELIELLPWYVNATLSEDERREADSHLASCASCRIELDELKVLQLAVEECADEIPAPSGSRLNQAMAEIDAFERGRQRSQLESGGGIGGLLERIGEVLLGWWGPLPAHAMVAAQFLLIVALAGGLGYSLWNKVEFSTLSGTQVSPSEAVRIAVRFESSATETQIRTLLDEIKGTIVGGPSSLGIYVVQVPIVPSNTAELEKVLASLRGKRQIVTYAEKME